MLGNYFSKSIFDYVLKAAYRDKVMLSAIGLFFIGGGISAFLGYASILESGRFAVVFTASSLRLIGVISLIIFVTFFIRRSFESRDIDYLLSRPITRNSYVISVSFAFTVIAFMMAVSVSFFVIGMMVTAGFDLSGHVMWTASLFLEFVITVNIAMFFAMSLSSATSSTLFTMALYVLGRLSGQILGAVNMKNVDGAEMENASFVANAFEVVSVIIPRLDLLAHSNWVLYGNDQVNLFLYAFVQGVVFVLMALTATIVDLKRREF